MKTKITVLRDFDGYFESLVRRIIESGSTPLRVDEIQVDASPYWPDGCTVRVKDNVAEVTFYSGIRAGFGSLSDDDLRGIRKMMEAK